jgi:hypothetical protein
MNPRGVFQRSSNGRIDKSWKVTSSVKLKRSPMIFKVVHKSRGRKRSPMVFKVIHKYRGREKFRNIKLYIGGRKYKYASHYSNKHKKWKFTLERRRKRIEKEAQNCIIA